MKGTELFNQRIKEYLERRAFTDPEFAARYANPKKSVEECCLYILGEVSASDQQGYDDQEIFGMAVHYYDEENVTIRQNKVDRVVTNRHVELTEEEMAEARRQAIADYQKQVVENMKKKPAQKQKTAKDEKQDVQPQLSLF